MQIKTTGISIQFPHLLNWRIADRSRFTGVLQNWGSYKFHKTHRETPVAGGFLWTLQNFEKDLFYRNRSSHQRCSVRKGVLKNFFKIQRETSVSESLFIKVAGGFLWALRNFENDSFL